MSIRWTDSYGAAPEHGDDEDWTFATHDGSIDTDHELWAMLGRSVLSNAALTLLFLAGIAVVFGLAGVLTGGHGA